MNLVHTILKHRYTAWACGILIFILCSIPSKAIPPKLGVLDKQEHFIAFGTWSFLVAYAHRNALKAVIGGMIFGVAIEFWQAILPESFHRAFDWYDAVADSLGAVLGVGIFLLLKWVKIAK